MPVNLIVPDEKDIYTVEGAEMGVAAAEISYKNRDDVLLISFAEGSVTSAVFTKNVFCAAPVILAKEHLAKIAPRALLINSGNANAVTGKQGLANAGKSCELVAASLGIKAEEVLPFSTGVIGEQLPMDAIEKGVDLSSNVLASNNWMAAAKAIMTTDVLPKISSKKIEIAGNTVTMTGIAKGSGMICPNMATMLSYVVTDAVVDQSVLDQITQEITKSSFNSITVDGDTSTNDSFVVTATQKASNQVISDIHSDEAIQLKQGLQELAMKLAQAIIRDGEGATKFVEVSVTGGESEEVCRTVAFTVANSPLVKTALFASDPNWGRLLMAIGRAPVAEFDASLVSVSVNGLQIVKDGEPDEDYSEEQGQSVFQQAELQIEIVMGNSGFKGTVWTSDLSHEYVTINAEYRS